MFRIFPSRKSSVAFAFISIFSLSAFFSPAQASPARSCREPAHTTQGERIRHHLQAHYRQWEGVRYLWGGETHRGIDCSAFVRGLFLTQFHIVLPRTSTEQKHWGHAVSRRTLRSGDLVFFKTSARTRHVGVYAGEGMFMHASGSHGVTLSRLDNPYWVKHFEEARRLPLS